MTDIIEVILYGKRVCTPPDLRSGGERSPPPCGPAVTMLQQRGALAAFGRPAVTQ